MTTITSIRQLCVRYMCATENLKHQYVTGFVITGLPHTHIMQFTNTFNSSYLIHDTKHGQIFRLVYN